MFDLHLRLAVIAASVLLVCRVSARPERGTHDVHVQTDAGEVRGLLRWAEDGAMYVSFRGVPYAKQPVGELRFKELQPLEPWDFVYDAFEEGPICPQTDILYGEVMQPKGMSEACIYANIHVPFEALPKVHQTAEGKLKAPYQTAMEEKHGRPILVFIHGGGFAFGSGDTDLHGPEYLVSKGVIVITFNYRLNVFGFLSLDSPQIPGNAGLRDMVTLLRWVQTNAQAFGGDPNDVTLSGQSAGAVAAHMLSLSHSTKGLFKRVLVLSGVATTTFISTSPVYAKFISSLFLAKVGINSTDPEQIHQQLVKMPLENIINANSFLLEKFGLSTFVPTIETQYPGITTVLGDDPEVLVAKGQGKEYPLLIGFTDAECEIFRNRFNSIDIVGQIEETPILTVPVNLVYTTPPEKLVDLKKEIFQRYYNTTVNVDNFIKFCTENYYQYPAIKMAEKRVATGGAPVYMYQFSYGGQNSILKEAYKLNFSGAGHIEDLTYVFRVNSRLGTHNSFPPKIPDDYMKDTMTDFVTNFMTCSNPICKHDTKWLQVLPNKLQYADIENATSYNTKELTPYQREMMAFIDTIQNKNYKV